ncbi:Gp37-like protein [Corynebacterium sp. A21]|uniref:Gp37-like protein n=1 Tax=Corynebacterium sp. A21 TaxID=3457318 RepID=UPI003FD51F95
MNPLNLRVWNNEYTDYRRLPGYTSLELHQTMGIQPATGVLTMPGDHPMAQRLMQASDFETVPVTAEHNGWFWTGKVDDYVNEGTPDNPVLTCTLVDDKDQLKHLRGFPSTRMPLEVQGKADTKDGPVCTVVSDFIAENMARAELDGYIILPPKDDKSPQVTVQSKMTSLTDLLTDVVQQYDIVCEVRMWWPGQPFPEGKMIPMVGGTSVERFHQITKAHLDEAFNPDGPPIEEPTKPGLLVHIREARDRSYIRWSSDQAGVQHFRMSGKAPGGVTQIAGGKSDDWINEGLDIGIDLAVQGILTGLGSSVGPIGAIGGAIVGDWLADEAQDTLFAYQSRTDTRRKVAMGPFHRREGFTSSSAGAFTFDTNAIVMRALKEASGGRAVEMTVTDGIANVLGNDWADPTSGRIKHGYRPGDRNRFRDHLADREIVDIISGVKVTDAVGQRVAIEPIIGATHNVVSPYAEIVGKMGRLFSITEAINMSGG